MDAGAEGESQKSGIPAILFLIAANLVPLYGAIYLDWSVFEILMLYWAENLVIGLFNLLKINTIQSKERKSLDWIEKVFFSVFFTLHFGGFCVGHGLFLLKFLGDDSIRTGFAKTIEAFLGPLRWGLVMLFLSHGFSFLFHFLFRGENRRVDAEKQMFAPYSRIVALHIAIVIGGIVVQAANEPTFLLVILVISKIVIDVRLHIKEHKKLKSSRPED